MITLVKIIHLLALMFGAASSFGSLYLGLAKGPHDLAAPDYTNTLRKIFRTFGLIAVMVLWVSGLLLMLFSYGFWIPGTTFGLKIALVILITLHLLYINFMAGNWTRSGGPPKHVTTLSWISAFALIGVVILASITFS